MLGLDNRKPHGAPVFKDFYNLMGDGKLYILKGHRINYTWDWIVRVDL